MSDHEYCVTQEVFDANLSTIVAQVKQILDCKPSAAVRKQASVVKVFHRETSRPIAEVLRTEFGMVVVTFRAEDTAVRAFRAFDHESAAGLSGRVGRR